MRKTLTAVLATAVVGGLGLSAPGASAAEEVTLYEADVTFCDSPDYTVCEPNEITSHKVLRDGVRLTSTSYDGYTSAKFPLDTTLAEVTDASMEWFNKPGSQAEPGIRIAGDFDDDGTTDTLWGESVYGGDWWLNGDSSQAVKDAAPSTEGGSGSPWHGTLEEWAEKFPDGAVDQGGYTLGVPADGILRGLTYAGTTYRFTNEVAPLPKAKPVADADITVPKPRRAKVRVTATQPSGTQPTAKGAYYKVIKVNPRTGWKLKVSSGRVFAGSVDRVSVRFPKAKKKMQVRVISYGKVIAKHGVRVR